MAHDTAVLDGLARDLCGNGVYEGISQNMSEFQEFLNANPVDGEGGTGAPQHIFLANLIWSINAQLVYEIGMNFGTCSLRLLNALKVTGGRLRLFEVDKGKEVVFDKLSELYKEKVSMTWGSSALTLKSIPAETPDLVFVDGNHNGDGPKIDIQNALDILRPGGIIVADDWQDAAVKQGALAVLPENRWFTYGHPFACMAYHQKSS